MDALAAGCHPEPVTPSDDLSPPRRPIFFPVVIATVFLTIIGGTVGFMLGERHRGGDDGGTPRETSTPQVAGVTGPEESAVRGASRSREPKTRPADIPMMLRKTVAMTTGKNSGRRGGGRSSDRSTGPGCHSYARTGHLAPGYAQ